MTTAPPRRPVGRPLGSGLGRCITFRLRLNRSERLRLSKLAALAGDRTPSDYLRRAAGLVADESAAAS